MEKKELRVLHLSSSKAAGGAERSMLSIAKGLSARGVYSFVASPEDGFICQEATRLGIEVRPIRIRGSLDPRGILALRRIVRRDRIQIIHSHDGKTFWPCVFVKWMCRGRVRVVLYRCVHKPHKFYSRGHYRFADEVIAVSRCIARDLIDREKARPERTHVIYNGVDLSVFHQGVSPERVRREYGLGHEPVVGIVGPMVRGYDKGQGLLIRAAARVQERFPTAKYLIVGDGEMRPELQSLSEQLGVQDKVVFAGYQSRIQEFFAAMDVFCLLSWRDEGLPNVMLEAQAVGKPVIGTDVGGIPETFEDGVTGLLVPRQDVEALVRALTTLLENEPLRREMGAKAAERCRNRFDQETTLHTIRKVYEACLDPGSAGPASNPG